MENRTFEVFEEYDKIRTDIMSSDLEVVGTAFALERTTANACIPISEEQSKMRLPSQAVRGFGCWKCRWRGTSECPFHFKKGQGHPFKLNTHPKGICEKRVNYLKLFYRGSKIRPTYTEWVLDYNQGNAQDLLNEDFSRLEEMDKRVEEAQKAGLRGDDLAVIRDLRDSARADWHNLRDNVTKYDTKKVERDKPKTPDVAVLIKPSDVGRLIKEANRRELENSEMEAEIIEGDE